MIIIHSNVDAVVVVDDDDVIILYSGPEMTCLSGILTHLWVTQYNCYRQFVEKRHCTCGKASKAAPQSMVRGSLHLEEAVQNDYSALTAAFTMYALSMMNNENSHPQG